MQAPLGSNMGEQLKLDKCTKKKIQAKWYMHKQNKQTKNTFYNLTLSNL